MEQMLTDSLKRNGGFTEGELATIRFLVKQELEKPATPEMLKSTPYFRLTNLHKLAQILLIEPSIPRGN